MLHVLPEPFPSSPHIVVRMIFSASRQVARRAAAQQCRTFSSTPVTGAAAEVKKLGVIGAGQMVRSRACFGQGVQLTLEGSRNSSCCGAEGFCAR